MHQFINKEQSERLDRIGINTSICFSVADLLDALCAPSDGEHFFISSTSNGEWNLGYNNAGDGSFHASDKELVELLVRFAEWKTPRWRINDKYYSKSRS